MIFVIFIIVVGEKLASRVRDGECVKYTVAGGGRQ
jgi:hypothetical protein